MHSQTDIFHTYSPSDACLERQLPYCFNVKEMDEGRGIGLMTKEANESDEK
jgi:hypothetical protein